jgi:type IV fimbrial biogenesis protein FimT
MRHQQGLTLIELMITLAILGVLVGVVFPGFQGMVARNNLVTSANSMVLAVNLARGEAVRQSGVTTLVALDNADAADEWGPGWQVLTVAAAAPAAPCARPNCERQFPAVAGGLTLDSPANLSVVQFTDRGAVVGGVPVLLDLCIPGDSGVRVTISAIGRPSTSDLTAVDCP